MTQSLFITATDTDAGKTLIAQSILRLANAKGKTTLGYKPISAGCQQTANGLRNEDAEILQQQATLSVAYEQVNPIAFVDPVAPHLAAQKCGETIELSQIQRGYQSLFELGADLLVVEGAGGWRLPLGQGMFLSDFVRDAQIPVVLVVGLKLGCLNHALLTYQALLHDGVNVVGWIANQIDPDMLYLQSNIDALHDLIGVPCLGVVPYLKSSQSPDSYININMLFED
ncbi:dethiobiotin synthase [Aliiglaciecola litoralis]|uniref:ATP-dependent dethiobiotin synthetase BioD n=1 Tax=Aliiglaciecola litoralis TaxID=582857 RepID=A0ABP3WS13_9ALTE